MAERRPFPWRWLWGGILASLLIVGLGIWWWFLQHTDLDRFAARARAAGIAVESMPPDPAAEASLRIILAPLGGVPPWSWDQASTSTQRDLYLVDAWDGPLAELDVLQAGRMAGGMDCRHLIDLLAGRIANVAPSDISREVRRVRRLAEAWEGSDGLVTGFSEITAHPLDALCLRLGNGDLPADEGLIADLDALAALHERTLRETGSLWIRRLLPAARQGSGALVRQMGIPLPGPYDSSLGMAVSERFGRGPLLDSLLAWQVAANRTSAVGDLPELGQYPAGSLWNILPHRYLSSYYRPGMLAGYAVPPLLRIRVLAAELRHASWPEDPYAPAGTPLRRVERDGRLVGAYSVGKNRVDDGGDRMRDLCLRLGAALGRPRMSDPAPVP